MTAQEQAARFNAAITAQTIAAVEDGLACCGSAYWTEGDDHCDSCTRPPTCGHCGRVKDHHDAACPCPH